MVAPNVVLSGARRVGKVSRTLFAALALLLTATHCVEIDDRELEETGGGACQRASGDQPCTVCLKANCCAQSVACQNSPDCQYFLDCLDICGDTQECADSCAIAYPEGGILWADAYLCGTDYCPSECFPDG